jgi:hypothetical protein
LIIRKTGKPIKLDNLKLTPGKCILDDAVISIQNFRKQLEISKGVSE